MNIPILYLVTLSGLIALSSQTPAPPTVPNPEQANPVIVVEEVKPKVELRKELVPICACESTGSKKGTPTHYEKDGVTVLRGKINDSDTGICQINLMYHEKKAKKMNLDLFKEEDNIVFANHLYSTEGSKPWVWSKLCWE